MPLVGPDPATLGPACGRELEFQPAVPFLAALMLALSAAGPSEVVADGSGAWVCPNPFCRDISARRHTALTPRDLQVQFTGVSAPSGTET